MREVFRRVREAADLRLLFLLLSALAALVALEQPSLVLARRVYRYVFVLDITESMNVPDMRGSDAPMTRIAFARESLARALPRLGCGSEAGIALFAEHRALLLVAPVEICAHYDSIRALLAEISWRLAWRGGSEIARGLDSSLEMTSALGAETRLVFLSDGHEAPPVHPELRMHLDDDAGKARGLIAGIGGDTLVPIPVLDEDTHTVGYWGRGDVQQVDSYSLGRHGSEQTEEMKGIEAGDLAERIARGTEHLSSLKEGYLRELAREARLDYTRLSTPEDLGQVLLQTRYAHREPVATDVRWAFALAALAFLVAALLSAWISGARAKKRDVRPILRSASH
jgi:mxaL protein